jgi:hypothetical protein
MSVQRVLVRARTHWLTIVGLGTQRSDDSVKKNLEHLERRICLTPANSSNADNEILLICSMLWTTFTQPPPT